MAILNLNQVEITKVMNIVAKILPPGFFLNKSSYASSPQLSVHRRKNVTVDSVLVETPLVETLLVKTAIVETMLVKIVLVEIEYWIRQGVP